MNLILSACSSVNFRSRSDRKQSVIIATAKGTRTGWEELILDGPQPGRNATMVFNAFRTTWRDGGPVCLRIHGRFPQRCSQPD